MKWLFIPAGIALAFLWSLAEKRWPILGAPGRAFAQLPHPVRRLPLLALMAWCAVSHWNARRIGYFGADMFVVGAVTAELFWVWLYDKLEVNCNNWRRMFEESHARAVEQHRIIGEVLPVLQQAAGIVAKREGTAN